MTKHQFIWLMIRFSGLFLLVKSPSIVFKIPSLLVAILMFLPANYPTEFITAMTLSFSLIEHLVTAIVIMYLLFRGQLIFNIVDRAASIHSENTLQKEEYGVILIRFVGVLWLYKMVGELLMQANASLGFLVFKSYGDPSLLTEAQKAKYEEVFGMFDQFANTAMLARIVNMVIFALLAWYFLKKAGMIIRWFGNRWLGKVEVGL